MIAILVGVSVFAISFLLHWLWKKQNQVLRRYFLLGMGFKIVCGLILAAIYKYYYTVGDVLIYFGDASALADAAHNDFQAFLNFLASSNTSLNLKLQEPRAILFTKFVSIVNLMTGNNYWLTTFYFSILSFLGSWYLIRKIYSYFPDLTGIALIAFIFFPSIVFWSSGLTKESIAVASLFVLSGLFIQFWFTNRLQILQCILGIIALWILWSLKYYYLGIFVPVVFTSLLYKWVLQQYLMSKGALLQLSVWILIFILPLLMISLAHPNFYFSRIFDVIVSNYHAYNVLSVPEDMIRFDNLEPTIWSFISHAPKAFFSGIFRPFITEATNVFQLVASVENLILLILFLVNLSNVKQLTKSNNKILLLSLVVYILLLSILITLSTPNFGTLSRYRIGYLPFFVFLVLLHNPLTSFIQRSWERLVRQ
jgi:hypothetical protein